MTLLLNGQAVKVLFGSTSVTCNFGSICLSARAQLAPPKPPPITTTRVAACASAGNGNASAVTAAALPPTNPRRLMRWLIPMLRPLLLCREPRRNRAQLIVGEALGDAGHHRGGKRAVAKSGHRRHDISGVATVQPRHGGGCRCAGGVAAGAGCCAWRGLGSGQRRPARCRNRCDPEDDRPRFHQRIS